MTDTWTIRRILTWMTEDFRGRGIGSPRLDGELLIAHGLGIDRVRMYMDLDRPLTGEELTLLRALVARRRKREPVAHILGKRDFFGRTFEVNADVLVPRPETELVVERALAGLPADSETTVLDLCTGSGCIGITLAMERPGIRVCLADVSEAALAVARRNVEQHGVGARVEVRQGDLFAACEGMPPFGMLVSNPPYVVDAEIDGLEPEVATFEPRMALAAGDDGLSFVRRIAGECGPYLEAGALAVLEIGDGQGAAARAIVEAAGGMGRVKVYPDLAGHDRVLEFSVG
ncbi:MAG: peptide chain release factor N(5)-glutamine methyltransferase [Myxococcales bacterium]|nr:peptide chain release factor N(5)-glutamine methyltransferase [Myxococcales bacterium]